MMHTTFEVPEDAIIEWRRYIHAHPELSYKEFETSAFVAEKLERFGGIEVTRPTETSVVGTLRGAQPGKTVALRADMDALPVQEETGLDFASKNPGVAHVCGHDAHTAMLLGTAQVLSGMTDRLAGTVKLIFQHAEEQNPGGAQELVNAGILEEVDAIFALHVMNQKPGTIQSVKGAATTSAGGFYLTIQGRGSHGSMPHHGIDPILVGSQVVLALNTIVSRSVDPTHMVVVGVGRFQSGDAPNVVPDTANLAVSVRTTNNDDTELVHRRCEEIIKGICDSYGATYTTQWVPSYAVVENDPEMVDVALAAAAKVVGEENATLGRPLPASEDFSAYSRVVPAAFIFLGAGTAAEGLPYMNHHPKFDILESCLADGTRTEVQIILDMLGT
ncbi:MAG: M20 metallopeptidase family protein [Anaerolineae bacterium]